MILPLRGERVDRKRRAKLRKLLTPEVALQRIDQLIASDQVSLHRVFKDEEIYRLCEELGIQFRVRDFTPATTLGLFVSQVLSREDACTTVVAKFNRERKRQGAV